MRNLKASIIIFLFDILALAVAFVVSMILAHMLSNTFAENYKPDAFLFIQDRRKFAFALMASAAVFTFYNRGHYTRRIPWWNQIRFICIVLTIVMFVDGFLYFAMKYQFSRLWTCLSWLVAFVFILVGRVFSKIICEKMQIWNVPTIIIGSGDNALDTMFAIHSETYTGYEIKTLILHNGYESFDRKSLPLDYANINIIDGSSDYSDYIKKHKEYFYMIAPDSLADFDTDRLVEIISEGGSCYAIVPPIKGMSLYGNAPQYFFGHDIMLMQPRPRINSPFSRIVKRGMDIFGSTFLLIMLSPLFLFLTILIRKEGGDAFFGHKRLGMNGKEFYCLKFRTMIPNAEKVLHELLAKDPEAKAMWDTHMKILNDPRVTPLGEFLRKSSIDELPQLVNVLKGEMSMVGPRPIVNSETIHFNKEQLACYLSVRPGITGLWQVSGRNNTTTKHKAQLDAWYVNNWSIWHDIVIIFKTFTALVKRSGAY